MAKPNLFDEQIYEEQEQGIEDKEEQLQGTANPIAGKQKTNSEEVDDNEYTQQLNEGIILYQFFVRPLRLATAKTTLKEFALENQPNSFKRWNAYKLSVIKKWNFYGRLFELSNFRLFQLKWLNDYQSIDIKEKHQYHVKNRN